MSFRSVILFCLCACASHLHAQPGGVRDQYGWIAFSQPAYYQGDTVHFTTWFASPPSGSTTIRYQLHLDVSDSKGQVAVHTHFFIVGGWASSYVVLPAELEPGYYWVALYSLQGDKPVRLSDDHPLLVSGRRKFEAPASLPIQSTARALLRTTVQLQSEAIATRSPIHVDVTVTDSLGKPVAGKFSAALVQGEVLKYKGGFDHWPPQVHIDVKDSATAHRINAGSIMQIKGRAVFDKSSKPVPDSTRIAVYLHRNLIGYECWTSRNGYFQLPAVLDFAGSDRIFYAASLKGQPLDSVRLEMENHPLSLSAAPAVQDVNDTDEFGEYSFQSNMIRQAYGYHRQGAGETPIDNNQVFEEEYGGADVWINVGDFVPFEKMEDVLAVIPSIYYRNAGNGKIVQMQLSDRSMAHASPTFWIDGIMTRDADYFMKLHPSQVVSIRLITNVYKLGHLGALGEDGIVIVRTKIRNNHPALRSRLLPVLGLSNSVPEKVVHEIPADEPAFHTRLGWWPTLTTDAQGKCSFRAVASDDIGPAHVLIRGITSDGKPFAGSADFEVRRREH
ncbi:MAG: hypothetical protein U0V64_11035 [Cyclobacteriaceae bacterium]